MRGAQRPRVSSVPSFVSSAGSEAADLAASAGLVLDDWQRWTLEQALGERADGKWASFEVGLVVARQNGKGSVLEARELAGLFLFDERLILHSAHEYKTAQEHFLRVKSLIDNTDHLRKQVKAIRNANGEQGIELRNGNRLRFVARSKGSGRGFSGDLVVLDEAYNLGAEQMAALLPTLSSRPNPQLWYASSAGMEDSAQLNAVRERGVRGGDPGLCYLEWSSAADADPADPHVWAQANPALGGRIPVEFVEREHATLPPVEFARERLSVWSSARLEAVVDMDHWAALVDGQSESADPVVFSLDMTPDRQRVSIAVAGMREDGQRHVEVVDAREGIGWAAPRLAELVAKWQPLPVPVDPGAPVGALIPELERLNVPLRKLTTRDVAAAAGGFVDAVTEGTVRHLGDARLDAALLAAKKRPLGDAFAFSRKGSGDISPLIAAANALHGLSLSVAEVRDPSLNVW